MFFDRVVVVLHGVEVLAKHHNTECLQDDVLEVREDINGLVGPNGLPPLPIMSTRHIDAGHQAADQDMQDSIAPVFKVCHNHRLAFVFYLLCPNL